MSEAPYIRINPSGCLSQAVLCNLYLEVESIKNKKVISIIITTVTDSLRGAGVRGRSVLEFLLH